MANQSWGCFICGIGGVAHVATGIPIEYQRKLATVMVCLLTTASGIALVYATSAALVEEVDYITFLWVLSGMYMSLVLLYVWALLKHSGDESDKAKED